MDLQVTPCWHRHPSMTGASGWPGTNFGGGNAMNNTDTAQPRRTDIIRRSIRFCRTHKFGLREMVGLVDRQLAAYGLEPLNEGELTALTFSELELGD